MEVELGKIVGVWGVKGWIKLHSFTRNRADIAQYKTWWLKPANLQRLTGESSKDAETQFVSVKVLNCREQGKGIVAQLEGFNEPDQALTLNGYSIWVKQADLPALPTGQFYWQQLIGLRVSNTMAVELGTIESILETGANDVLVIKAVEGSEVLVPYADEIIQEINIEQGTMIVDWDPSYLDE